MVDLSVQPLIYIMLVLHCVIGVGAAILAQRKGFDYGVWLVWGLVGGTAALVHAAIAKPRL